MGTVELKPCPFCGSKDIYRIESHYSCQVTFACSNCDASVGWKENTEDARKAWNTRFNEEEKEMIDYSKIDLQKVHMKRHLELAVVAVENDIVKFKVSDQFYCGDEFSKQEIKSEFKSNHGLIIQLDGKFEWDGYNGILTLNRFQNVSKHEETTLCTVYNFAAIMEAITEYNETDGKGYEDTWPKDGSDFYYVSSGGYISQGFYSGNPFWRKCVTFGNFFRTKKEAEAALERVKKALKGEN